jgi:phage shock protein C
MMLLLLIALLVAVLVVAIVSRQAQSQMGTPNARQRAGGPYRAPDGLLLGVCKGIARHLDFPVFWLRLFAVLLMVLTGFCPMIVVYFVVALIMKPEPALPLEGEAGMAPQTPPAAPRPAAPSTDWRRVGGPYRARDGLLLGVCKGCAQYLEFSAFWLRLIAVVLMFFTGIWPMIIVYFVAALIMKPEPVLPLDSEEDAEFYNTLAASRPMALNRLKTSLERLDRRIRRLEDIVTARDYDWDRRLNE